MENEPFNVSAITEVCVCVVCVILKEQEVRARSSDNQMEDQIRRSHLHRSVNEPHKQSKNFNKLLQ